ncbi:MAG TPA: OsmC family protein [Anaerolineales bacterium]|nr:OsmC family protein [Anaerolineales bacterium]HLE74159.1 OsmC family protein [Anaerolineales bacterium]
MNSQINIRESLEGVIKRLTENPEKAVGADSEAVTVLEEGLRVRASGPNGQTLVCDMPKGLGGQAAAPSPGWMARASLANCEAVMIALRAAQLGVKLKSLEVRVDSVSDDRGMLGTDHTKPAGPLNMKVSVRVAADESSPRQLHEIIEWAVEHSPVGDTVSRGVPIEYVVQVGNDK